MNCRLYRQNVTIFLEQNCKCLSIPHEPSHLVYPDAQHHTFYAHDKC